MARRPALSPAVVMLVAGSALAGCRGSYESMLHRDLDAARRAYPLEAHAEPRAIEAPELDGSLDGCVRAAIAHSPSLRAAFERWQASALRIARARRLPEPTLTFAYFARAVETRVGPQRARLSLRQSFPWPTRLTAGADAAATRARAMQRRFEAEALAVAYRVADGYWHLWQIRTARAIHRDHLEVMRGLSESARARLATGTTTLAALQQIDLSIARLEDRIQGMDESERGAVARLRAAIGVRDAGELGTSDEPADAAMPRESVEALGLRLRAHPTIERAALEAEAAEEAARAERAARLPSFTLGADWVVTGEAASDGVGDSGRDAVVVSAGLSIPLWQVNYADGAAAAVAESRAHRADRRALLDRAEAELAAALANLRDRARRVALYRGTLVPQAETAYASVLGAYAVGRGALAETLLSQRDVLELRVELVRARADHARTWARLEALVGEALTPRDDDGSAP
ncbi:MAG: TolC family protein [Myxococcota bacterium]